MARTNSILMGRTQGAIGKELVFRVRGKKTFISKYPDMSQVIPSVKQLAEKSRFACAVKFAQNIIRDPARKAAYKVKKGKSVYHTAIKDYLKANK